MKANKERLFSIKNKALKKERKYSLLVLRIVFILGAFSLLGSLPSFFAFFFVAGTIDIRIAIAVAAYGIFFCVIWVGIYRLQFWPYPVLCLCTVFFAITMSMDMDAIAFQIETLALTLIPLIAAWRVRSFLQKQAKEVLSQEDQNTTASSLPSPESFIEK